MTDLEAVLKGWTKEACSMCNGTGQESDFGNGNDFHGSKECGTCKGNGAYWITPKGKHVLYIGGPFI